MLASNQLQPAELNFGCIPCPTPQKNNEMYSPAKYISHAYADHRGESSLTIGSMHAQAFGALSIVGTAGPTVCGER